MVDDRSINFSEQNQRKPHGVRRQFKAVKTFPGKTRGALVTWLQREFFNRSLCLINAKYKSEEKKIPSNFVKSNRAPYVANVFVWLAILLTELAGPCPEELFV